jgi:5'-nucleotidase
MNFDENRLILVTNDDGITAPGIQSLVNVASKFGKVVVVAPDSPQSGMGHAITMNKPLRIDKNNQFGKYIDSYHCSGTPVDCVKLAVSNILSRPPDLLVSGINHGANSSINIIYSGTMSAAMEGAIGDIPSIGFSLLNYSWDANFDTSELVCEKIIEQTLVYGIPTNTLLNVNIPDVRPSDFQGFKVCRQAKAKWVEDFQERTDPFNRNYYWMTGEFVNMDKGEDTDVWALDHNYASVVPVQFDLTAHHAMGRINNWSL